jgi:SAM-dependent methyltransferase
MKDFFSAFGEAAERNLPPVMVSGRHIFHGPTIAAIVDDIIGKLRPKGNARLLEIGCGVGLMLRPLAPLVAEAVGIDHCSLLREFSALELPANVRLLAGRFPEIRPDGRFHYILIYSVLQYMAGADEARGFVNESLELLAPGGRLLIGDLPNADSHRRFCSSTEGRRVTEDYALAKSGDRKLNPAAYAAWADIQRDLVMPPSFIDDSFLLALLVDLRRRGYESYLLPQPHALPFSLTREDLLIRQRG